MKQLPFLFFNLLFISWIIHPISIASASSCVDNPDYVYKGNGRKNCDYIATQREKRCIETDVAKNCPKACRRCCESDASYRFETKRDGTRECEWLEGDGKNERNDYRRRRKHCRDEEIKGKCVKSCNNCPTTPTTKPPTPVPKPPTPAPKPPTPVPKPPTPAPKPPTPAPKPPTPVPKPPTPAPKPPTPAPKPVATPTNGVPLDPHGIQMIYASEDDTSPKSFAENDWFSKWETYDKDVSLQKTFATDPNDGRVVLRGNGDIKIYATSGELQSDESPRVYISSGSDDDDGGWEDVEVTAYGKYLRDEKPGKPGSNSGLTLVARTSHSLYSSSSCRQAIYAGKTCSPCKAAGYYARIYRDPKGEDEIMFQKEYYHHENRGTVYTVTRRVTYFPGRALPVNQWIGMKFVVYTVPDTERVQLELYYDGTDGADGGNWVLIHNSIDDPAKPWKASSNRSVPSECPVQNGKTVLGPRDDCILRSDDSFVRWKKASVRRISTDKL